MKVKQASFVLSAPSLKHCPDPSLPEFCFAGRSNVGKSSIINALVNRTNLARTSNVPGKTQEMNYYLINQDYCFFVDLPGYGFAKVSQKERQKWGRNIRKYVLERETLCMVFVVVDARHNPTTLDQDMMFWLAENGIPFSVILSKSDKLKSNERRRKKGAVEKLLEEMNIEVPLVLSSASRRVGVDEVLALVEEFID